MGAELRDLACRFGWLWADLVSNDAAWLGVLVRWGLTLLGSGLGRRLLGIVRLCVVLCMLVG